MNSFFPNNRSTGLNHLLVIIVTMAYFTQLLLLLGTQMGHTLARHTTNSSWLHSHHPIYPNSSSFTTATSSPTASGGASSSALPPVGIALIVVFVLGIMALLILLCAGMWLCVRRWRRRSATKKVPAARGGVLGHPAAVVQEAESA